MKIIALILTTMWMVRQSSASALTFEDVSPRFPTNTLITWKASTNHLPARLHIYLTSPRIFSATVISNAIALTSLPMPRTIVASTNDLTFRDGKGDRWSRALNILPMWGQIDYEVRSDLMESKNVPNADEVSKKARELVSQFDIDPSELIENPESRRTEKCKHGESRGQVCSRGTFLTRKVDGVQIRDVGFQIELGAQAQIRRFAILWPELKPVEKHQLASPDEIIRCIRAQKTPLAVNRYGYMEWAKLGSLTNAKSLSITRITPVYTEGRYAEEPPEQGPNRTVAPFAELEAVADLGGTNINIRLLSPILSVDAKKLLKKK